MVSLRKKFEDVQEVGHRITQLLCQAKTKIRRQHVIRLESLGRHFLGSVGEGLCFGALGGLLWLEGCAVAETLTCVFGGFACGGQEVQAGASYLTSSTSGHMYFGHACMASAAEPRRATTTCAPAAPEGNKA